ncbi:DNA repair protein REV1-like isoform X2 [Megalops cyprinoides]|uniref:DNA repair protein REV1-like isoform X2 n=1 Tax=Megalops cyprinoides TaxID=118141 RepID=UPI001864C5A2|nr:DNA repair protein REV1-like isoform X2 [Megalops cyprinoides]
MSRGRGGWRKRAGDSDGWGSMGGYMAAKVSKLEEQFRLDAPREKQKEGLGSNIFRGVAIYVNGYTDPAADELRRLMMLHGGQFHVYYSRSKTTHIIATNLPNSKIQELRGEKVVRPDWITDSIKAGRLLSYLQYQLYSKQRGLNFPITCMPQTQEPAGPSHFTSHSRHAHRELGHAHPADWELGHSYPANREPAHTHSANQDLGQTYPFNQKLGHAHPSSQELGHTHAADEDLGHAHPDNRKMGHAHNANQDLGHAHPANRVLGHAHPANRDLDHAHSANRDLCHAHPTKRDLSHTHPANRELGHTHPANQELGHTHPANLELGFRLNGSLQTWPNLPESPKMNGVQGKDSEPPDHHPCSSPWVSTGQPLTNGHAHPANGALKPLDLALHSGRYPLGKRQHQLPQLQFLPLECKDKMVPDGPHAPSSQHPNSKPGLHQSPERQTPTSQASSSPKPPSPQPKTRQVSPSTQQPTHQLPANQKDATAVKALPPATPPPPAPRSPCAGKPSPRAAISPPPGRVRLNGTYRAPPQAPTLPAALATTDHSAATDHGAATDHSVAAAKPAPLPARGNIISEFYSHSRLHHISTWRSEFSEYVSSLQHRRRAQGGTVFPGKERLRRHHAARGAGCVASASPQNRQPCILHVDMDCFFVSVGIRYRLELKGKPVAVTSNRGPGQVAQRPGSNPQMELQFYQRRQAQGRGGKRDIDLEATPLVDSPKAHSNGVDQDAKALSMAEIASCSYEARQAGVRNGMFFGQAKQLCPELQAVPYDFQAYKEVALAMYETLASYTHNIEALSCDEALMDATSLLSELGVSPDELASAIREDVRERTGCPASVGMGSNILLARMATRKAKPDGQYYLKTEEVDDFIRDQSVTSLPGVGRSMGYKLASLGVRTCGDLQQVSMSRLQKEFGPRTGQTLFRFCRGLDDRPVRSERERKSVSAEMNYGIRFTQVEEAESFLTNLALEVERRLQAAGLWGRRLTLKVMVRKPGAPVEPAKFGGHGICDNLARTVTLERPTDNAQLIAAEGIKLFHSLKLNVADLRGVGMQVQQLVGAHGTPQDPPGALAPRHRSVIDMLLVQRTAPPTSPRQLMTPGLPSAPASDGMSNQSRSSPVRVPLAPADSIPSSTAEPMPGTSKGEPPPRYNGGLHTPKHTRTRLNLSIEVPSPSQVDRSVLDALPAELREQVEQSWSRKDEPPRSPAPAPPPLGTLVLQVPDQPGQGGSAGIVLALPDFSQVDPEVFQALPPELQEELRSAYRYNESTLSHSTMVARNPLLQLKQPVVGRTKRRYKKNASPAKKGPSPLKNRLHGNSPAKSSPAILFPHMLKHEDAPAIALKLDHGLQDIQLEVPKITPRPGPTLAGACELSDIRTLLKEWVTTIAEPMEEDILQVVKYCSELVEDRDLERLDLVIKYMKRLMQQSVDSVWNMAFDFILDNVQVVVQQTYGSTLKIT